MDAQRTLRDALATSGGSERQFLHLVAPVVAEIARLTADNKALAGERNVAKALFDKWHTEAAEQHARAERLQSELSTANNAIGEMREALAVAKECIEGHFDDGCEDCRIASATIDAALAIQADHAPASTPTGEK